MIRTSFTAGAALLILAGCGEGSGAASQGATVRDSLGVSIVENPASAELVTLGWMVSEAPSVVIGTAASDPAYQLFRVQGAAVLPGRRIAVANAGSQEIRFFDAEGRHLTSAGGRGDGPGEFQLPQLVPPVGNEGRLLIWDPWADRFTLLGPEGELLRTIRPTSVIREAPGWDGVGAVLSRRSAAAAGLDTPDGTMVNDVRFEVVPLEGGEPTPLAVLPHRIYHAHLGGQPWFRRIPFDPEPSSAAGAGRFHLTGGDRAEVRVHGAGGEPILVIRVLREPEPVDRAELSAVVEEELASLSDENLRREWRVHYGRMPFPETIPIYRRLLVDEEGHVWAERFRSGEEGPPTWSVFDARGRALGTIRTPPGLTLLQIGTDFLLGHRIDALGVEQVVLHPLDR